MKFNEINPFVRYAMPICIFCSTTDVVSRDCRLFYVLDGEGEVFVGCERVKIASGSVLIWNGGNPYRFTVEKPLKMMSVNFDYTQKSSDIKNYLTVISPESFSEEMRPEEAGFDDYEILNKPLVMSGMTLMREKLERLSDIFLKKEMCYSERCSALLKDIIIDILQGSLFSSPAALREIEKVMEFIHENYSENIRNESIAKSVNYHPYYLSRLMLKYTGFTLHKYLLNYRLEKAGELLLNKSGNISQIAEKCGFNSSYHLSNAFKEKYGCSPAVYRKKYMNMP